MQARRRPALVFVLLACSFTPAQEPGHPPIDASSLLRDLVDLDRLARWPDPPYETIQYSSTDRRTVSPDQPGWFANQDGFGQEPMPGFERVLREPDASGTGEDPVCDVEGPGTIVRGWSAGMAGVLRVVLDGAERPLFEGPGYDFLARRSTVLVPDWARVPAEVQRLLVQVDADYLPIPFQQRLRVTWTGRIRDLHFYHLQVRRYPAGTAVTTFAAAGLGERLQALAPSLAPSRAELPAAQQATLAPGEVFTQERTVARPDSSEQLVYLRVRITAGDSPAARRAMLLRITMDGAGRPQVEAPLDAFFATGPGAMPTASMPLRTGADGALVSLWRMPYARTCRIELHNLGTEPLGFEVAHAAAPLAKGFPADLLYFHALWRVDHDLHARAAAAPIDLPLITAIGRGRFVGLACQIVNPPMSPLWRSNWWGEGDEKFTVDGKLTTLGTGAEDYFDYSWSRWDLFDHPFCGQPLASGPGNCGHVENHRLQIIDDLPFTQSFAASMELWSHKPVTPLSWGRTVYFYARPSVITDHRAPQPAELVVPALAPWQPADFPAPGGDAFAVALGTREDGYAATAGKVAARVRCPWVRSGEVLEWLAPAGGRLTLPFGVQTSGLHRLALTVQHRVDAPSLQLEVDGVRQQVEGHDRFAPSCAHGERWLDAVLDPLGLQAGRHELAVVCPDGGAIRLDLLRCELRERPPAALPGALDAELWDVVRQSDGVAVEIQHLGTSFSMNHQRWVKASRIGDAVTFRLSPPAPGRHRVVLRMTRSWDFGIVGIDWQGVRAAEFDAFCGEPRAISAVEVDLGERDFAGPVELTFTLTGKNPKAEAPGTYFGIDCALLRPPAGR